VVPKTRGISHVCVLFFQQFAGRNARQPRVNDGPFLPPSINAVQIVPHPFCEVSVRFARATKLLPRFVERVLPLMRLSPARPTEGGTDAHLLRNRRTDSVAQQTVIKGRRDIRRHHKAIATRLQELIRRMSRDRVTQPDHNGIDRDPDRVR